MSYNNNTLQFLFTLAINRNCIGINQKAGANLQL